MFVSNTKSIYNLIQTIYIAIGYPNPIPVGGGGGITATPKRIDNIEKAFRLHCGILRLLFRVTVKG